MTDWRFKTPTAEEHVDLRTPTEPLTNRELLARCAEHFEFLRRVAMASGPVKRNGVRVNKMTVIADECRAAQVWIAAHLAVVPDG